MGGFIDETATTNNPASVSELRCGNALAALLPAKHVVVLKRPSGHRGAVGGSGATADFLVYTGGNGKTLREIEEDENHWGTLDAYTPESGPDQAAKMVRNKLSTQALGVIVDLENFGNEAKRADVVNKVITMVDKEMPGRLVIFHHRGTNRVHNKGKSPFRDTGNAFV